MATIYLFQMLLITFSMVYSLLGEEMLHELAFHWYFIFLKIYVFPLYFILLVNICVSVKFLIFYLFPIVYLFFYLFFKSLLKIDSSCPHFLLLTFDIISISTQEFLPRCATDEGRFLCAFDLK